MKLPRRKFMYLAAGIAALTTGSRTAKTGGYPTRPVRLLVGFTPGGGNDITARLVGQWLSEHLGQPFIIENRPGASTNIATEAAVNAAPDGYTLLFVAATAAINATLYENLNFNFIRDVAPIAGIMRIPNVMVVNPSLPVQTVPQFIAYAKANPGKVNMASPGVGTSVHLSGELFKMMTGVDLVHVPYRGGYVPDLLGGQTQVVFGAIASSIQLIGAGKLRALAVTTAARWPALPDVPAMGEYVPGYNASQWYGLGVPKNTPAEIVSKLNSAINAGLADPTMEARFANFGYTAFASSPAGFGKFIAEDIEKWAKVVKFAGIKPE